MLYHVNGELVYRDATTAVIDCGGVGYKLTVTYNTSEAIGSKIGQKVKLFTYMQVREDDIELFGFISQEELSAFKMLISVSGVGPKAAISILSSMTPDKFALCVCTEDVKSISKAQGVGAKTAARIILELKDKISKEVMSGSVSDAPACKNAAVPISGGKLSEAAEALAVLGYDKSDITAALRGIDVSNLEVDQIITAALKKFLK